MDTIFKSALGRDRADKSDENLAKIQSAVLAACSPIANLWVHLEKQGFKGKPGELIPTEDVTKVAKDMLALLGNASSYISQVRRTQFIGLSMTNQRPAVARFLRDVSKEGNCGKDSELFGSDIHKKVTDRADTIDAFNKAVSKVERHSKAGDRFLSKRPTAYGSRPGREYTPPCSRQLLQAEGSIQDTSSGDKENSPPGTITVLWDPAPRNQTSRAECQSR